MWRVEMYIVVAKSDGWKCGSIAFIQYRFHTQPLWLCHRASWSSSTVISHKMSSVSTSIALPRSSGAKRCSRVAANQNSALWRVARPLNGIATHTHTRTHTQLKHLFGSLLKLFQNFQLLSSWAFLWMGITVAPGTDFFLYLLNLLGQPSCSHSFSQLQSKVGSRNMQQTHLWTLCSHR